MKENMIEKILIQSLLVTSAFFMVILIISNNIQGIDTSIYLGLGILGSILFGIVLELFLGMND